MATSGASDGRGPVALVTRIVTGRLYYGWYIIGVFMVSNFFASGLNNFAPAVFLKPMTEELGWGRGFFSTAVALGMLFTAPLSMLLWPVVDRRGARGVMLVSGIIVGFGTMAVALVQTQWHFVFIRTLILPFGMVGMGPSMASIVLSNWYVRKRGRVLSTTMMGMSLGGIFMPPLATFLLAALGWRLSWVVLGIMALALLFFPALLIRRRPEDMSLLPDGDAAPARAGPQKTPPSPEVAWSRREALRNPTFWLLAFSIPLGSLGMTVVFSHLYPYLTDLQFSPRTAALTITIISVVSLLIKMPWGFVMERLAPRVSFAFSFILLGLGLAVLVVAGANIAVIFLAVAILGMGWGGRAPLMGLIWANYYGRRSLGTVQSLASPFTASLTFLGPALAGFVWDATGSYRGIFTAYIGVTAVSFVLMMLAMPPTKKARRAGERAEGLPAASEKAN